MSTTRKFDKKLIIFFEKSCIKTSIQIKTIFFPRVSPNLKFIVYCTAIKHGDSDEWDFAWHRFMNTSVSSEKEILLQSLGCSREPWILSRYLERSIMENGPIRKQDTFRVFSAVSTNSWGQSIAFNFIKENWKRLRVQ